MADSTVIWLFQPHAAPAEIRVIDVIKGEGVGLDWYVGELEQARERHGSAPSWLWGDHILPHDVAVREMGTGKSRIETLRELGIDATICPNLPVADGIQAVRALIPRCWFDRTRCARGLEALRMYRRDYDEKQEEYRVAPLHDWTSHYADAFRYFAVGYQPAHAERLCGDTDGRIRGGWFEGSCRRRRTRETPGSNRSLRDCIGNLFAWSSLLSVPY